MKVKSWVKLGLRLTKFVIVLVIVFLLTATVNEKKIFRVENFNFNRTLGLTAMALKDSEEKPIPVEQQTIPIENNVTEVKDSFTGDLTGYAADCPLCNGTLACLRSYNVYKNDVVTYEDETFGNVRIVASSKKLPCGSIIKFESKRVAEGDTYAIVLDRGVTGTNIDLLVPTEAYASKYIGRSSINYDVLRLGW